MLRDPPSDRQALDFLTGRTGGTDGSAEGGMGERCPSQKKEGSGGKASSKTEVQRVQDADMDATRFDPVLLQKHLRTLEAQQPSLLQQAQRRRFRWKWSEAKRGGLWSALESGGSKTAGRGVWTGGRDPPAEEKEEKEEKKEKEEERVLRAAVLGDAVTRRVFSRLGTVGQRPSPPPPGVPRLEGELEAWEGGIRRGTWLMDAHRQEALFVAETLEVKA